MYIRSVGIAAALFLIVTCHPAKGDQTSGTLFADRATALGLTLGNDAACWVDIDNDGWADLCAGGAVWRNIGGKTFKKLADAGSSVAADFDNDGFADLFSWSNLTLLHNEGGTRLAQFPLLKVPATVSRGACWGDFNGDGFVDLYVGGFEDWDKDITYPSLLLLNEGGRSFKLAWSDSTFRTRGVTACDFDRDGDLDIYVSNYRLQPNRLMLNDGHARFTDAAALYNVVATSPGFDGGHSIGACWGDFDNDGRVDLFAGNFAHVDSRGDQPKSRFLRNPNPILGKEARKGAPFEDFGPCGVFYQESYASPAAGDYDNDGNLDLYFTTVYGTASFGKKNFPVLFRNQGRFAFADSTASANLAELAPTYQAAWSDFDHDGDLDLVTAGKFFVNCGGTSRWLEVRLLGDGRTVNRSAIGAQVRVKLKDRTITRQVEAGTGEGNQNDLTLHFGLGRFAGHVNLEILWPNGAVQNVRHVGTGRIITLQYMPGRKE